MSVMTCNAMAAGTATSRICCHLQGILQESDELRVTRLAVAAG
jgi:hypothetical protein